MTEPLLGIVADDLSGAAECASHALLRVPRSRVVLVADSTTLREPPLGLPDAVVTVDTDSRRLGAPDAVRAVRAAATLVVGAPVVVKKVDSLLRGHLAAEVAALADELGRTPVVAVANPGLGRVVREGVLHVGGTPLHETDLWAVESTPAPSRVAEALHPLPTVLVPHAIVLRGIPAVTAALADAAGAGLVAVCDAVTDADLDVVHAAAVAASAGQGRAALLVGSGALADAAVRALPPFERRGPRMEGSATETRPAEHRGPEVAQSVGSTRSMQSAQSVLFVLGTRAPGVTAQIAQIAQLSPYAAATLLLQPDALLGDRARQQLIALPRHGVVVLALDPDAEADPSRSCALTEALAAAVAPLLDGYDAAFLSGGETARAVLDRLRVESLDVVDEVEPGTVVSRRSGGRIVVTRPGSFGGPSSLVRVAEHLLDDPAPRQPAPTHTATRAVPGATTEENS